MENFTLSMSIQNLPQETLKLVTKVPEKLDAFLFWGFFWDGILSDTNYFMNGNSYPIVPYSYISERLDADQRLTTEAQRRAIEVLKEKRDLRSIVPWWKPSVRGDFRKSWGSMGCCRYMRELILSRADFFGCHRWFFVVKWRSPRRLKMGHAGVGPLKKIWETGDFHLTESWAQYWSEGHWRSLGWVCFSGLFYFSYYDFLSSGACWHHPLSCVWGSKLSIYKLSEVHWVHWLITSFFFKRVWFTMKYFLTWAVWLDGASTGSDFLNEDIRRFWVEKLKVQDHYCRPND